MLIMLLTAALIWLSCNAISSLLSSSHEKDVLELISAKGLC